MIKNIKMKKIVLYLVLVIIFFSCSKECNNTENQKEINSLRVNMNKAKTRVLLEVDGSSVADNTYWQEGDFIYVCELTRLGTQQFTSHTFKYDYVPAPDNESEGLFAGVGIITSGRYLLCQTNIIPSSVYFPTLSHPYFEVNFQSNFTYKGSFGTVPNDTQKIADNLLFIAYQEFNDSEPTPVEVVSPMSMLELSLIVPESSKYNANNDIGAAKLEVLTITSDDACFSYTVLVDESANTQTDALSTIYESKWTKLSSSIFYPDGYNQSLSSTAALKARIIAFQKEATTTTLTITASMTDGKTIKFTTPPQTQTLQPNVITVVDCILE